MIPPSMSMTTTTTFETTQEKINLNLWCELKYRNYPAMTTTARLSLIKEHEQNMKRNLLLCIKEKMLN